MSDLFFRVQEAVYAALAASADVVALLGDPPRIYDHVPPGAAFPYAVFGPAAAQPLDDLDRTGMEQTVTLDIWSRYRGGKEAKDIMQACYATLQRAQLDIAGFVSCEFAGADIMPESDGLTTGVKMHFTVVVENQS